MCKSIFKFVFFAILLLFVIITGFPALVIAIETTDGNILTTIFLAIVTILIARKARSMFVQQEWKNKKFLFLSILLIGSVCAYELGLKLHSLLF